MHSILPPLRRCWRAQLPFRAVQVSFESAAAALLDVHSAESLDPLRISVVRVTASVSSRGGPWGNPGGPACEGVEHHRGWMGPR